MALANARHLDPGQGRLDRSAAGGIAPQRLGALGAAPVQEDPGRQSTQADGLVTDATPQAVGQDLLEQLERIVLRALVEQLQRQSTVIDDATVPPATAAQPDELRVEQGQ